MVRPRIWAAALAITVVGVAGAVVAWLSLAGASFTGQQALSPYDQQAIVILASQSTLAGRWNDFLDDFNAPAALTGDEFVQHFGASLVTARMLVNDSQAVITRWRRLEPPAESVASHRFALDAMLATQHGFILLQNFLESAIETGVSDASLVERSQQKLDEAAVLWEQARESDRVN